MMRQFRAVNSHNTLHYCIGFICEASLTVELAKTEDLVSPEAQGKIETKKEGQEHQPTSSLGNDYFLTYYLTTVSAIDKICFLVKPL